MLSTPVGPSNGKVNGKRIIQSRSVVRGFKDLQAAQLSTFAGTTTRWGQRLVNSVAAQQGWPLFTADVSQAFPRGLAFEQAAQMKDGAEGRTVHCTARQRADSSALARA